MIINVSLDATDAALVGTTLRMLARSNHAPDPTVAARLLRVGEQLASAAKVEQVLELARVRGERGIL